MIERLLRNLFYFILCALLIALLEPEKGLSFGMILAGSVMLPIWLAGETVIFIVSQSLDIDLWLAAKDKLLILISIAFVVFFIIYAIAYRLMIVDYLHLL